MNIFHKITGIIGLTAMAGAAAADGIADSINEAFANITGPYVGFIFSNFPGTPIRWIVAWLVIAAVIFTLYLGFVQIRGFKKSIEYVSGKHDNSNDPGEITHFQALTTALSATVGLGNIAGVAVAVAVGGAGATFWMIVAGLLGMALKFAEVTLGVKYRNENADGTVSGGPMYYITKGFAERGLPSILGSFLAILFAIFCIFGALGGGNMFQANQAHQAITGVVGDFSGLITGIILAVIVFVVIVGGLKSIANVTDKIVPFMGALYVICALIIILMNYQHIGKAFSMIIDGAFTGAGLAGGALGALIQGFQRAAFSNEAGVGSAPIAHSAVKTDDPVSEGVVALLEPFIDTVVICTMTALVIIITGQLMVDPETGNYILNEAGQVATVDGNTGVSLTQAAFASQIPVLKYALTLAVVLFAFSTMIAWSYYGEKAVGFLFSENSTAILIYKVIFCIFIVIGASVSLGPVIDFSDAAIFSMAVVNLIGVYLLMPVVRAEMKRFFGS